MRIISGKYGRRRFDVPTNITARPTTDMARENIFNVLGNLIDLEGMTALDLFAGTGAMSFEFLSRGCTTVTSVEKASTQFNFIKKVSGQLGCDNHIIVKGDVFRFIGTCKQKFDVIFADPPYALPQLPELPRMILESYMLKPGTLFIIEHSRDNDFSQMPHFLQHRVYGKVNFTIFQIPEEEISLP